MAATDLGVGILRAQLRSTSANVTPEASARARRLGSAPPTQTVQDENPSTPAGDPRKYRRIGRWYIAETLGKGGYGWVKKGYDCTSGQPVALKFIMKAQENAWKDVQKRQITQEIEALRRVRHKNVIRLLAYNMDAEYPQKNGEIIQVVLLVLEFAPGGELYDILFYTRQLHVQVARTYFVQLIDAVEACHQNGVIHRDIKPQNMLLDKKYRLRLADFGLGKIFQKDETDPAQAHFPKGIGIRQMQTNYVGTKGYRAPELNMSRAYNNSVDIFACGVVLFIFLNGYPPFVDTKRTDRWYSKIREERYDDFWRMHRSSACMTGRMTHAKDLLLRMLEYNPDKRISIADIRRHPWVSGQPILRGHDLKRIIRRLHARTEQKRREDDPGRSAVQIKTRRATVTESISIPLDHVHERSDTRTDEDMPLDVPQLPHPSIQLSEDLKRMRQEEGFADDGDIVEFKDNKRHRRVSSKGHHHRKLSTSHGELPMSHIEAPPMLPLDFVEHCRDVRSDLNYQTLLSSMYEIFIKHGCYVVFDIEEYKFLVTTKFSRPTKEGTRPIMLQFCVQFWLEPDAKESTSLPQGFPEDSEREFYGNTLAPSTADLLFGSVVYDSFGRGKVQHIVVRFTRVSGDPFDWFKINHVFDELCKDLFASPKEEIDGDDDDLDALPSDITFATFDENYQLSDDEDDFNYDNYD